MKQSVLSFTSPSDIPSTSRHALDDSIVIADSDGHDGFETPPPPLSFTIRENELSDDSKQDTFLTKKKPPTQKRSLRPSDGNTLQQPRETTTSRPAKAPDTDPLAHTLPIMTTQEGNGEKQKKSTSREGNALCHQHRQPCTTLLQCTYLKTEGQRCSAKYCFATLSRLYRQQPEQILRAGRNLPGVDVKAHVGPEEANYLWKCPRCRNNCQCSICRRKIGLEPLGTTTGKKRTIELDVYQNSVETAQPSTSSPPAAKRSAHGEGSRALKKSKKVGGGAGVDVSAGGKKVNSALADGFAKACTNALQQDELPNAARATPTLQQQTFQRPLRKPKVVELPSLRSLEIRLPHRNVLERIWLYETLIRFDILCVPRGVLKHLDKFEDWTEGQVQTILEKLICRVAGVSDVRSKAVRSVHKRLLESFQLSGGDLERGEAWEAAKNFCTSRDIEIVDLESVDILPHQVGSHQKIKEVQVDPSRTLLNSRVTRSKRLAELQASRKIKDAAVKELEDSEEEGSSEGDEIEEEEEEDESDRYDASRRIMSTRKSRPSARKGSPTASRRSARQRGNKISRISTSAEAEEVEESSIMGAERKETPESEVEEVEPAKLAGPVRAPPFEERIAILSGLVRALIASKEVIEEINVSLKISQEIEKAGKEEEKELVRQQEEDMRALQVRAPSMTLVEDYCAWKEEFKKAKRRNDYSLLDSRMRLHLQLDAHKTRSGPLGVDVDGNEYWQLSEYLEEMPQDTTGHWAWSLLVIGSTFYEPLNVLEKEQKIEGEGDSCQEEEDKEDEVMKSSPFYVVIDVPTKKRKKKTATPVADSEEAIETDAGFETPPPHNRNGGKQVELLPKVKNTTVGFSVTNDHTVIGNLIDYIKNRVAWCEFEEATEERKKNDASAGRPDSENRTSPLKMGEFAMTGSSRGGILSNETDTTKRSHISSIELKRRRRAELKELQLDRQSRVEALTERLILVKQYYQWHAEEGEGDDEENGGADIIL
ncbi:hypothetical protein CBS101457_002376 [Exobasidium rhododendri]|nr:hypothetical protein CBS101457_002376 [Exobasidium rhododendri]